MSADRNKIARELTGEDLQAFLDRCWKTPGLTLARIQEIAAEYGIAISLMAAKSFRDTTYARHLQRIGKAGELAAQVAALRQAGAGHTIADAAAAIISDEVLDQLVNRDPDSPVDLDVLSKIVKRLRDSDTRTRALEHVIERHQWDAAKAAMKHAKEIKTICGDRNMDNNAKIEAVRRRLWGEAPADFVPHRETGAAR